MYPLTNCKYQDYFLACIISFLRIQQRENNVQNVYKKLNKMKQQQ